MTPSGGVRVRAGALRGRVLAVPDGVRPTEGRVREAFFDILGPGVAGCRFLDLFAGSGAVGIEAVSRGAAAVVQVDLSPAVLWGLKATYRDLGLAPIEAHRLELPRQLSDLAAREAEPFDWIFADPPYDFADYEGLLAGLPVLMAPGGAVVIEHEARRPLVAVAGGLTRFDERRYGDCALSFYASSAAQGSGADMR